MRLWQYILLGLAVVFIGIQFVPNELPAVKTNNPGDLVRTGLATKEIATMLKSSCYSCHSNETNYPWYSYVAPSSWLVAKDVREGREELNFSDWTDFDMMDQLKILDDIAIEVKDGRMPMEIYTLMHPSVKLDDAQRAKIVAWAEETMDIIAEEEDEEELDEEG
jgi:hypothetical protein